MTPLTRRGFLKVMSKTLMVISGMLGFGGIIRYLEYKTNQQPQIRFDIGSTLNYPVGSNTVIPNIPAYLIHSEAGFFAISLTCTHLGCTVEHEKDGFNCPCHGSRFREDGEVDKGPAKKNLPQLRVEITKDDHIILYTE